MKKILAISLVVVGLLSAVGSVYAGDREWATAGKILTGVVAADVLTGGHSRPYYHGYDPYYYSPSPYYYSGYYAPTYYRRPYHGRYRHHRYSRPVYVYDGYCY